MVGQPHEYEISDFKDASAFDIFDELNDEAEL